MTSPAIEPEEPPWCEWCGWSLEFCTCIDDLKFEEEEEWESTRQL